MSKRISTASVPLRHMWDWASHQAHPEHAVAQKSDQSTLLVSQTCKFNMHNWSLKLQWTAHGPPDRKSDLWVKASPQWTSPDEWHVSQMMQERHIRFVILFNCPRTNSFQNSQFCGSASRAVACSCNTFQAALTCLSSVNGAPTANRRMNCPDRTCLKWLEPTCPTWSLQISWGGKKKHSSLIHCKE